MQSGLEGENPVKISLPDSTKVNQETDDKT